MRPTHIPLAMTFLVMLLLGATPMDERPADPTQWGFRPQDNQTLDLNPPRFSWRPQRDAAHYTVEASRDRSFRRVDYRADEIDFNVHAPAVVFEPGRWYWRFRFTDKDGNHSAWSTTRQFTLPRDAVKFPFPDRAELVRRLPTSHPRLFLRPENLDEVRARAQQDLKPYMDGIIKRCESLLSKPIEVEEPPTYPPGTVRLSEEWREIWWGNRLATIRVLESAAQLAFAWRITGDERYANEARRLLMEAIQWDPKGSTGYIYNDEAGMPYAYHASRAYTFLHDFLNDQERERVRQVMRIRGQEMYNHLCPSHLWAPYGSHRNRAWHFLGEVAVAFHGEIPEADDWLHFAMTVFANVYPVWNDSDGGWHEGVAYWRSYLERFAWWADIMHAAFDINAYELPFFSQVGYYPIYLQPPGTQTGGFADQAQRAHSRSNGSIMEIFAAQAQNGHWQWYADAVAPDRETRRDYVGLLRAARLPKVQTEPPTDLPSSRVFRGTGLATLNTNLLDGEQNVQILFKSSPMGSISHGYDAQNCFQLNVFGHPVFLSSGLRDIHGSEHHRKWMWETKSVNSILVSNRGQRPHSPHAIGKITAFRTTPTMDYVEGDASQAYDPPLKRFTRGILFIKPDIVLIHDELETDDPETFQWLLHANQEMVINGQSDIRVQTGPAAARVNFLVPEGLHITQTDQFDPPPRERVKLTQYHLTASTVSPTTRQTFLTLIQPHRAGEEPRDAGARVERTRDGYRIHIDHPAVRRPIVVRDGTLVLP